MTPPKFLLRFFSKIHVVVYRRSNGGRQNRMNDLPVMLLTTTGRRTGRPHTVPVVYLTDQESYLVAPGVVPRPDWYLNLKQTPRAEIQIGDRTMHVAAEELTGAARRGIWKTVPDYWKEYERRAGITLPLVRLRIKNER